MSGKNGNAEAVINKPLRHFKVSYVRVRHEDRKTGFTRRISRHASLTMNGDWLETGGVPNGHVGKSIGYAGEINY